MKGKISVIGLGIFGSVNANMIAENCYKVVGYTKDDYVDEINRHHTNNKYFEKYNLKDFKLSNNLVATSNLEESVRDSEFILLALPSGAVVEIMKEIKNLNDVYFKRNFVILSKGIDKVSGKFLSEIVENTFPTANVAVMYGPNFAQEIAVKEATISTFACKDMRMFEEFEDVINNYYFKIKYFDDPIAVQLCGLVKNVLAIICGIVNGLGLGKNTSAAIMVRGVEEVYKLCNIYGCNVNVINTSAGIGDMILTCGSQKSRNMSFGFKIGSEGHTPDIIKSLTLTNTTLEGLSNAENLSELSKKFNITNSLADVLLDIVNNDYTREQLIGIIRETIMF